MKVFFNEFYFNEFYYSIIEGVWKYSSHIYDKFKMLNPNASDYPFIIAIGPFKDAKNNRYPTCSFNTLLVMNGEFVGQFFIFM